MPAADVLLTDARLPDERQGMAIAIAGPRIAAILPPGVPLPRAAVVHAGGNAEPPCRGMAFVVDASSAKVFALAHWLVGGADGGQLFVRCFDGTPNVRENFAGDVPASGSPCSGTDRRRA
ncbi:hypothetical protein [Falsiroseomonas sp. E2-1-a20]|uniref:hypothetical protein n=1 Tax=Falsiroseomonas sp. E2-1-a20 TaxID=3239300 RepID=UPI003F35A44B